MSQLFLSHPKVPGALTRQAESQRARGVWSLHFKAASLGNVSRARKPRLPGKQGPRGLNFVLLTSNEAELPDRIAGTGEREVKQGEKGNKVFPIQISSQ